MGTSMIEFTIYPDDRDSITINIHGRIKKNKDKAGYPKLDMDIYQIICDLPIFKVQSSTLCRLRCNEYNIEEFIMFKRINRGQLVTVMHPAINVTDLVKAGNFDRVSWRLYMGDKEYSIAR